MKIDKSEPKVVVLMLTYNGKKLLEESIPSYLENKYGNFELVIIDNGSSDGTFDFVSENFPGVHTIRLEKNRGYSGGFNFGIEFTMKNTDADYILVSNDDIWADSNLISELVKVAENDENIGFVTGKVYFYNEGIKTNILQTVGKKSDDFSILGKHIGSYEEDLGQYDVVTTRSFCDDVFTLVRKEVIVQTKGYDENFFLQFEETDWQLRAKKLGYKIYYTPHAKLWHKVGMSTGGPESPERHFNFERNEILLIKRHGNTNHFLKYLFYRLFYRLPIRTLRYILSGKFDLILANLRGTASGIIWTIRN